MSNTKSMFCFNNYIDEDADYSVSSESASYPASNLVANIRSKVWQAEGKFEITSANNKVYINGTTYTLTAGSYTVAALISHFNSVTSQTLSRNPLGRFVITLGGSGTLNLATTANAIWSTLGFLTTSNLTGTAFTANDRRYTTGEWIKVDVGMAQQARFAAVIPPNEVAFGSSNATIKIQGNNVDLWDSPPVDTAMEVSSVGAFAVLDEDTQACRYWRIFIDDVTNSAISAAVVYIGDAVIPVNTNIATGFTRTRSDASVRLYSESGQLYVDRRPRFLSLSNIGVQFLKADDLEEIEQLFYDLGVGRPFFLVIDPNQEVSTSLSQMTHYVQVDSEVGLTHVLRDYYNLSVTLREVI